MKEIIEQRDECSKLYAEERRCVLEVAPGIIHYKDNYDDKSELWKDIDLSWEGNRITRAPFELTVDGTKITIRDKKTNKISVMELLEVDGVAIQPLNWVFSKEKASLPVTAKAELTISVNRLGFRLHRAYLAKCLPFSIKVKQSGELITSSYGRPAIGEAII